MFCFQCEQTKGGSGCLDFGVCGKDATTSALQDLLTQLALAAARYGAGSFDSETGRQAERFVVEALFTTVTNVNFDPDALAKMVRQGGEVVREARTATGSTTADPLESVGSLSIEAMVSLAEDCSIMRRLQEAGEDVVSLQELALYGIKGLCAYLHHARVLGFDDDGIRRDVLRSMAFLASDPRDVPTLIEKALGIGELNLRVMELLDRANTTTYGHPVPTPVRMSGVRGKAILVSGHDLKDLEELLKQTEGAGINVYTHGEMLPAHGYPELKKHTHLVGNYGGAWQLQLREFAEFPGAILMTTNCIQSPRPEYVDRIFTSGLVGWPGVRHIEGRDFRPVIEAALAAPGFAEDEPELTTLVGFGHNTLMENAGAVIDAVKSGALRHIFLIGGCDGARFGRNYFTELAEKVPQDCVILTLACGKYRFNKLDFGTLGGLPRLLDVGQCNDAYSAIVVASELAKAFGCGVNELPLSLVLSWYEQKAVAILLTLLHLGIKNIRIGPTLPAFVSPNVLSALVENFRIQPIRTPEEDLQAILG